MHVMSETRRRAIPSKANCNLCGNPGKVFFCLWKWILDFGQQNSFVLRALISRVPCRIRQRRDFAILHAHTACPNNDCSFYRHKTVFFPLCILNIAWCYLVIYPGEQRKSIFSYWNCKHMSYVLCVCTWSLIRANATFNLIVALSFVTNQNDLISYADDNHRLCCVASLQGKNTSAHIQLCRSQMSPLSALKQIFTHSSFAHKHQAVK